MNRTLILMFALVAPTLGFAFGNDDKWVSGFGQGTKEATITKGPGNSIYVACQNGGISESSVTFYLANTKADGEKVFLSFDNDAPEEIWISNGSVTSNCRACAANFDYVIDKLKSHSLVNVLFPNGDNATFSLSRSREAIGDCKASFYIDF